MNQVEFYIIRSETLVVPAFFNTNISGQMFRPAYDVIEKQIKELNLNAGVNMVDIKDIPVNTQSFLVCILGENSLVPDDYVARLLSMNNLHRNMSLLCGPVNTTSNVIPKDWFISKIAKNYKNYEIDGFSSFISCYLNNDESNYPPIEGCIFSGRHYNECGGYRPIFSPRYLITKDSNLLSELDKSGPIIYSDRLRTITYISSDEYEMSNFSKYYYRLGYYDGTRGINHNSKILEITDFERYNKDIPEDNKEKYLKISKILECMYKIGHTEAVTQNAIL